MPDLPDQPLTAALGDLETCLRLLGKRPLKLIAGAVVPEFSESPWVNPEWSFSESGGQVADKKLLANPEDSFQFSIGGPESGQDYHRHDHTFEIYVSAAPIAVRFEDSEGRTVERSVANGVLIVPPGIAHRVTLTGTTFCFQAATGGAQVHGDRSK
ncbi:MAG TPA: hypothetical protein VE959_06310 [Bryobacteraceae bacterium]|nr:hypothetical protein [Bryobacteraceae bacterium]